MRSGQGRTAPFYSPISSRILPTMFRFMFISALTILVLVSAGCRSNNQDPVSEPENTASTEPSVVSPEPEPDKPESQPTTLEVGMRFRGFYEIESHSTLPEDEVRAMTWTVESDVDVVSVDGERVILNAVLTRLSITPGDEIGRSWAIDTANLDPQALFADSTELIGQRMVVELGVDGPMADDQYLSRDPLGFTLFQDVLRAAVASPWSGRRWLSDPSGRRPVFLPEEDEPLPYRLQFKVPTDNFGVPVRFEVGRLEGDWAFLTPTAVIESEHVETATLSGFFRVHRTLGYVSEADFTLDIVLDDDVVGGRHIVHSHVTTRLDQLNQPE